MREESVGRNPHVALTSTWMNPAVAFFVSSRSFFPRRMSIVILTEHKALNDGGPGSSRLRP